MRTANAMKISRAVVSAAMDRQAATGGEPHVERLKCLEDVGVGEGGRPDQDLGGAKPSQRIADTSRNRDTGHVAADGQARHEARPTPRSPHRW